MSLAIASRPETEDQSDSTFPQINVPSPERVVSLLAGAGLLAVGCWRRSWSGLGLCAIGAGLMHRGLTGNCRVYRALGIDRREEEHPAIGVRARHGSKYQTSFSIQRPVDEVFRYWRTLENLPTVMHHLVAVEEVDATRSHWVAKGPMGIRLQWEAEIITEKQNELLAWRSTPGSEVDVAGSVAFAVGPAGKGTVITVSLKYDPPGGKYSAAVADFFGTGLHQRLEADVLRLKQTLEAGEAPTVSGQPQGRCCG